MFYIEYNENLELNSQIKIYKFSLEKYLENNENEGIDILHVSLQSLQGPSARFN